MTPPFFRLGFAALVALDLAVASSSAAVPRSVPVEVWASAHDDLTGRLSAAISVAFNETPGFATSIGKRPGSLYVTITGPVRWTVMGPRAQLTAPVAIANRPPNAPPLIARTVSCRDDRLMDCAGQVVGMVQNVAQRVHLQSTQHRPVRSPTLSAKRSAAPIRTALN